MIDESKKRLREYIEEDKIYQDYKSSGKEPSDFERFCFVHCRDIENVLNENQKLQTNWKELKKWLEEYGQLLEYKPDSYEETMNDLIHEILDKMQEIERGKNE